MMAEASGKAEGAFRTIGEVAADLGLPQHILRYWETRFSQLRPLQRAGNRRYYRPADVELVHRINRLLNQDGYTVRGVKKLLDEERGTPPPAGARIAEPDSAMVGLRAIRESLAQALAEDARAAARP
jgi:DNA-binding transcriptional MerR regulator